MAAELTLGMTPARFVQPLEQPCESIHLRIPALQSAGSIRRAGGLGL
jgi:hypothetical protein